MSFFPNALENLIDQFAALPGVGRKSAQRLAFHVLSLPEEEALKFAAAIVDAKKNIHCCSICQNLTDQETCTICASPKRDQRDRKSTRLNSSHRSQSRMPSSA